MQAIVTLTINPTIDTSSSVVHVFAERKLRCEPPRHEPGGGGDSMVAGIVLSLARGRSLRDSVRFGVAAGTAAVMTPGTELCRREDTEYLYEQMIKKGNKFNQITYARYHLVHFRRCRAIV